MSKWTRPTSVPFPNTWATFEGRTVINGRKRSYWIQDISAEYKDQVVNYMVEGFTVDEPLCKYSKTHELPDLLKALKIMWNECLNDNMGLVCLTKDDNGKSTIAAMNCTSICSIHDNDDDEDKELKRSRVIQTLNYAKKEADGFKRLNITEYLDGLGLYVLSKYRGEGLGLQLLKAREPLCRACGLTASLTFYSSIISQTLAVRAGFKDLYTVDYEELEKKNPLFSFPGIQEHTKGLRYMYILYQ